MTDVHFYHLERQTLEYVLPVLLERSLQRGWRAVVQTVSEERMNAIDGLLWTYSQESFLAHGTAREGDPNIQPVYLTTGTENPNGAVVRFFVEGCAVLPALQTADAGRYERALLIFDGRDAEQLAAARIQWRELKAAGHGVTYWQQNDDGRWEKKA
jgi:DNA polymerase-3 subunit chi